MSRHCESEFRRYMELRQLISQQPDDVRLLKQELRANYYWSALITLADVKRHLDPEFCERFFGRRTNQFFGTYRCTYSRRSMTVSCFNGKGIATYAIEWSGDHLTLRCL